MTCEQAELFMAELLSGELPAGGRADLDRHLLDCGACRQDFQLARRGFRVEWPDQAPSRETVQSTLHSFQDAPALLRFFQVGTAAAAALLVGLLLLGSGGRTGPAPVAAIPASSSPQYLAAMPQAVVGTLEARDEEGRPAGELGLQSHVVSVEILDGIAKTTVEENFRNHTDRRLEGTFRFPLPADASISRLALEVNGKIEEGTCLERERAREVFEGIVRRMKDPALLEWMPGGIFQCRIFPIDPRGTKRVIVAYTQALPYFRGKATYHYPLVSEKTKEHPPEELRIEVTARFSSELKRIESPSHEVDIQRARPNEARMTYSTRNLRPKNDFVLAMETADDELRVVPHKVDGEDGYFALFLTPRGAGERRPGAYTFILDRSAAVTGPELEVARGVVRAMMERRMEGDRFEILAHNIEVESSGPVDLRAANDFMDRLLPIGGCDVEKALLAAPPESEVIYIGSGTPTYGETDVAKILEAVKGRRIRTIGVGSRVQATLLERLGGHFRISPNDEVGKRLREIAATLGSAPLSGIQVDGGEAIYDVVGVRDLFFGERLVVTGRYRGPTAKLVVAAGGYRRELAVAFPSKEEGNNYVRRLWAQRKISDLLVLGEAQKALITDLGIKYQIMTPYTSFLVLENEQMWKDHQLKREVQKEDHVLSKAEAGKTGQDGDRNKIDDPTGQVGPGKARAPSDRPAETPAVPVAPPAPKPAPPSIVKMPSQGEEWGELVSKRQARTELPGMPSSSQADDHYRLAERLLQAGEFEQAALESEKVLKINGQHALAKALQTEVEFNLGRGRVTAASEEYDGYVKEALTRLDRSNEGRRGGGWFGDEKTLAGDRAGRSTDLPDLGLTMDEMVVNFPSRVAGLEAPKSRSILDERIGTLDTEKSSRAQRTNDLPRQLDFSNTQLTKQQADTQVFLRQLEVQQSQIQALTATIEEHRAKLAKTLNEKSLATAELGYARQQVERLSQDLAELEGKHVDMARDKKHLEEKINHLNELGVKTDIAPKKPMEGKVTAVANEIGLVVISIGKDAGVMEGDEFTIYRGGDFVAKIQIDRADRQWSAGKVVLKKTDPRVGDEASNHIYVSAPRVGDDSSNYIDAPAPVGRVDPTPPTTEEERADRISRQNLQRIREKFGY